MGDWPLYLAYRGFAGLFGLLPHRAVSRVGAAVGRLGWMLAKDRRSLVERHLARVLQHRDGTVPSDLGPHSKRMFASYGRYWAEVFWVRARRKDEVVASCRVVDEHRIHEAKATGRGIVLALPHMGNWEAAGAKAEAIGIPVLAVAEGLSNAKIVDWFRQVRSALGIDTVITGEGSVTAALMRRLNEGGTIALVADRDVSGRGVEVELFGEKTTMPAGPIALADRSGAVLLPVACYFDGPAGHRFEIQAPLEIPDVASREDRVAAGTQAFAKVVEELVSKAPHDWHLFVPNWPSDRAEAIS